MNALGKSAATLHQAIVGVGPKVPVLMPQNAPERPDLPPDSLIRQNKPTAGRRSKAVPQNAPECPETPRDFSKAQNKATAARGGSDRATAHLTPRQLAAIDLLFIGATCTRVCRELHVDRKTLFRWRSSPAFMREVSRRYHDHEVARKPRSRAEPLIPYVPPPLPPIFPTEQQLLRVLQSAAVPPEHERFWVEEIRRYYAWKQRKESEPL